MREYTAEELATLDAWGVVLDLAVAARYDRKGDGPTYVAAYDPERAAIYAAYGDAVETAEAMMLAKYGEDLAPIGGPEWAAIATRTFYALRAQPAR